MVDWMAVGNILQLGLTVTFFGLVLYLNWVYGPTTIRAFTRPEPWTAPTWLAVGITVGFNFNVADWGYWGITWLSVLFELPSEEAMFDYGPISNLFLRQIPTIYSVSCHLIAAKMIHGGGDVKIREMLFLGACSSLLLWGAYEWN